MRWTRKTIIEEIRRLHESDENINYSAVEANHLSLVRAAAWHFGKWRRAVEEAGIDYESLSRYKRWSKERIIARIQELYEEGYDLSWRSVSQNKETAALAASALRPNGFGSWPNAIEAAGYDINEVSRYKYWNKERVLKAIKKLHKEGASLSSRNAQKEQQSLFCAARRRYGTWDKALEAAGLDPTKIRIRRPPHAGDEEKEAAAKNRRSKKKETPKEKAAA